MLKFG